MFVYFPRIGSALGSKLCCIFSTPEYVEEGFYGGSCNSVRCCCIADENAIFDHSFNFFWLAFFRRLFLCAQSPSRTSNFYYQFWTCFASMRLSVWQLLFCLFLFFIVLFTCWIVLGCWFASLGILLAFWGGLVGWLGGWGFLLLPSRSVITISSWPSSRPKRELGVLSS